MDPFKNIAINLNASGPAAVLIVVCICITLIALYGSGVNASYALGALVFLGASVLFSLSRYNPDDKE